MNDKANVDQDQDDVGTRPPDVRSPLDGMSAQDAAVRLGMSERTIRRAIARGELVAVKQGASFRIAAEDLERYAARAKRRGTPSLPPRRIHAPSPVPRLVALPVPAREAAALPEPLSSFVGRRDEIAAVLALVGDPGVRLLTLTGPGGIGKSRLALQVAAAARDAFPDGAVFVELAPISRSEQVAQAIGQALGLREGRNPTWEGQLQAFLRSKRLLLVLDNFEQVLDAAPLVAELVREARGLTVLATSRAPLRLTGEREYAVPPLSLSRGGELRPDSSDAVRLFVERARANRPTLALTDANAETIAEICRRLDGLPLAIELAAARSKVLSPAALLARLTHRLELLTGGPRDQPPRLRTMRDAVAWSHDLLTPEEQALFRRLAVFAGGFVLGAAERVAGDDPSSPVLDVLASLVDKSLVQQQVEADEPRFALLETVREFGLETLTMSGEEAAIRRAHAAWCLALAEAAEPELTGPGRLAWLGQLEAEDANLLSALDWLVERGDPIAATRLAASLWPFWYMRNSYREGMARLQRVLALPGDRSGERYATVLLGAGFFATSRGEYAGARSWLEASLAISLAGADPFGQGWALFGLGEVARFSGDDDAAVIHLEDALRLLQPASVANWLIGVLNGLGDARRRLGELELAAECLDEALALARQTGDRWSGDQTRNMAARVAYDQGDVGRAAELWLESLTNFSEARDLWNIAWCLAGLGSTAVVQGQAERAVRLFGASEALQEAIGGAITSRPNWPHAAVDRARRDLGEAGFAAAWAAGRALPPEAAIAEASAQAAPAPAPAAARRATDHLQRLTAREQDVLRLLVEHRTNREIGAALFLSPRTVAWHVSSICAKLGVASRREATAVAIERGLV